MNNPKSPFLVFQDFLDSATCDQLAAATRVELSEDTEGRKIAMERHHAPSEAQIFPKFKELMPQIEAHFKGFTYRGTEHLVFQQFPANGKIAEEPHCENSVFKRKKWLKVKERDLTAVLWLKDYQDAPPFNIKTQVLGGKLEFPQYSFGFQPQKGTLVVYPANPRFISLVTMIQVGELQQVRFHICAEGTWEYDPERYSGDYRDWFKEIV